MVAPQAFNKKRRPHLTHDTRFPSFPPFLVPPPTSPLPFLSPTPRPYSPPLAPGLVSKVHKQIVQPLPPGGRVMHTPAPDREDVDDHTRRWRGFHENPPAVGHSPSSLRAVMAEPITLRVCPREGAVGQQCL